MDDQKKDDKPMSYTWVFGALGTILAIWIVWVSSTISPMESRVAEIIKSQEAISTIRNSYMNEKFMEIRAEIERLKRNEEILFNRTSRLDRSRDGDQQQ